MSSLPDAQKDKQDLPVSPPHQTGRPVLDSDDDDEQAGQPVLRPVAPNDSPPRRRSSRTSTGAASTTSDPAKSSPLTPPPDDEEEEKKPHVVTEPGPRLPCWLGDNLDVIFCGQFPGAEAAANGHHFSQSGEKFYNMLHDAGFTTHVHPASDDQHFPALYSIGLTTTIRDPSVKWNREWSERKQIAVYRQHIPEVVEMVLERKPLVLAVMGKGTHARAWLQLFHLRALQDPSYTIRDAPKMTPSHGWMPFKIDHGDRTTYFYTFTNPSKAAAVKMEKRMAELAPLRPNIEEMKTGTWVEPFIMYNVNLAPLRRLVKEEEVVAPPPPQLKRSASPLLSLEQATVDKKPRPSFPNPTQTANAVDGPSRLRNQELGLPDRSPTPVPQPSEPSSDPVEAETKVENEQLALQPVDERRVNSDLSAKPERLASKEEEPDATRPELEASGGESDRLRAENTALRAYADRVTAARAGLESVMALGLDESVIEAQRIILMRVIAEGPGV